jgi:hypothetical protein
MGLNNACEPSKFTYAWGWEMTYTWFFGCVYNDCDCLAASSLQNLRYTLSSRFS